MSFLLASRNSVYLIRLFFQIIAMKGSRYLKEFLLCDFFFPWGGMSKYSLIPHRALMSNQTITPPKSSIVKQWIYGDYSQKHRGGLSCISVGGRKPALSPGRPPSVGDDSQKLLLLQRPYTAFGRLFLSLVTSEHPETCKFSGSFNTEDIAALLSLRAWTVTYLTHLLLNWMLYLDFGIRHS